jgi:molybdopterin/thiamine biosynthesis adenylyltransferase
MFAEVRGHVEDVSHGEAGAFLLCGYATSGTVDLLLARGWIPIPQPAKPVRGSRYGLAWSAEVSADILARADHDGAAIVLVHSHGSSTEPKLSGPDQESAGSLFPGFSRVLAGKPSGSVVLGDHAAAGEFWRDGRPYARLTQLKVIGARIDPWPPVGGHTVRPEPRRRHDRQVRAIGPESEAKLAAASVAVVGVSGGGSHVCQQLAHLGFGRIVPIDDDIVEEVNLGRMIGSRPRDVGRALKTEVMVRLIRSIDPGIAVEPVDLAFPAPQTMAALKTVDVVIACVDSFSVREQINAFCRRHHLPLIDIGLSIETKDERLVSAHGQMTVVTPDSACLRCGPLLSDEVLAKERRERPPGYDVDPNAPGAPQVVSMNGALASEAANSALDFVTGYAGGRRGSGWWLYDGRAGTMQRCEPTGRRRGCPACAEQARGDAS